MSPSTLQVPSVDQSLTMFPEPVDKIESQPDYDAIRNLRAQLKANASAIDCNLGGDHYCYLLGLIISDHPYATISLHPFHYPANPGLLPVANGTAAQIAEAKRNHSAALYEYQKCRNMDAALRKLTLNSVPELYYSALKQPHVRYSGLRTHQILEYLPRINQPALADNDATIHKSWNPQTLFEAMIHHIKECIDYANAGGQAYTTTQILNIAYALVFHSALRPPLLR
jgi:hypothetical protein